MTEKPPLTMRDVAARAGVSRMTVSLALRNHPSLPSETRQRVRALAEQMGYRPNPGHSEVMARIRAGKRLRQAGNLAFLTGFATRDGWREDLFVSVFQGARDRAAQLGYGLEEVWIKQPGMTGQRLTTVLGARGIRGLILGPLSVSRGHVSLDWSQFAVVAVGYSVWRPDVSRAVSHNFQNALIALRELRRLRYHRIGFATTTAFNERINYQAIGAFLAFEQRPSRVERVPPLLLPRLNEASARRWFEKHRPEAVLYSGVPLDTWLRNWGVQVPQDVAIANLSCARGTGRYAGIDPCSQDLGAAAVDLVVRKVQRNELGIPTRPETVMIPGYWIDGPTVRRR